MTRSKKKRRRIYNRAHRETQDFTNRRLVGPIPYNQLTLFEDRRQWTPSPRNAKSFSSAFHRLTEVTSKARPNPSSDGRKTKFFSPSQLIGRIAFEDPNTLVCVRRKVRKEVLHARKKTGRRGQKPKKFNFFSDVSCKKRRK